MCHSLESGFLVQVPYRSVFYSVIGNEQAAQFFVVDRVTGDVKLKTSLLQDPARARRYQVSPSS